MEGSNWRVIEGIDRRYWYVAGLKIEITPNYRVLDVQTRVSRRPETVDLALTAASLAASDSPMTIFRAVVSSSNVWKMLWESLRRYS